eukprot:12418300-Heterocapsa_arctica.AAC.1
MIYHMPQNFLHDMSGTPSAIEQTSDGLVQPPGTRRLGTQGPGVAASEYDADRLYLSRSLNQIMQNES